MFHSYYLSKLLKFCLVLSLLIVQVSLAQTGSIMGNIYDKTTKDGLPGANILVKGTSIGAASDLNGKFILRNVPTGMQTFVVTYIGYVQQSTELNIVANRTLEQDFALAVTTLEGQEVIITAQAQGQLEAINQQLASDKIANIVSETRIQELPDFNVAASIGRLPGISTLQSSGEANKIVIRGLAPQYNQITIDGFSLASTGSTQIGATSQGGTSGVISNDRSVDLSMISPYMVKTITVYKSLTPDMNANALGGVVNMELREAPSEFHTDLLWQSGYTAKSNTYGNYRGVASVSKRFFDDMLGVYLLGNLESYDRNSDNMNASYSTDNKSDVGVNGYHPVKVQSISLNRHIETRKRYGGNLILDYQLPAGTIKLINMFSRLNSDYKDYRKGTDFSTGDLSFNYREGENDVDAAINSLNFTYDFGFMSADIKAANTYSRNNLPYSPEIQFTQTSGVGGATVDTKPEDLTYLERYAGADHSFLNRISLYSTDYKENGQAYKGDFKFPFNVNSDISGYFKFGGEYQYIKHKNSQTTPYADFNGTSNIQNRLITGILDRFPELRFDSSANKFPSSNFTSNDADLMKSFLDNRFGSMLWITDPTILNDLINYVSNDPTLSAGDSSVTAQNPGGWFNGLFQTQPNSYTYNEKYYAAYLMSEVDLGNFSVVGGIRYEKEKSDFTAYNLKDGRDVRHQTSDTVTVHPGNEFWLPMVQAKYKIADWVDVRYAYTQTLARPDYHQLSPHFDITNQNSVVRSGNPKLRAAHSYNHDLIFTIHNNEIGLFSVGGFYKTIKDFTYSTSYTIRQSPSSPGLDSIGSFNVKGVQPNDPSQLYTYINTPYLSYVKGIEIDLQTRFWYLPAPFNGMVFGINYTRIWSEATYPWRDNRQDFSVRPPRTYVVDSTRVGRLINQPNDIVNSYIGYDYAGFSARVSFIFQGNSVSYVGNFAESDGFTKDYFRIDASVRQILPWYGIEVYLDMNNLNSETNQSAQQSIGGFTNEQNYGLTANLGVRYRL